MYIAVKPMRANGKIVEVGEKVDTTGWNSRRVAALVQQGKLAVGPLEVMTEEEYDALEAEDPHKVYAVYDDAEEV